MVTLEFRPPGRPVSMNDIQSKHWSVRRRVLEPWRDAAWASAKMARAELLPESNGFFRPSRVRVWLPFANNRRRDPHNYTSTVVKAIIDGLVLAKVWPDDTAEWVEVMDPTLYQGTEVRVLLLPRHIVRTKDENRC